MWFGFQLFHVSRRRISQFGLGSGWGHGAHGLFQIGIEPFVRVELGVVTGQKEHFDFFGVCDQLFLGRLAVIDTRIVHNQERLAIRVFNKAPRRTR